MASRSGVPMVLIALAAALSSAGCSRVGTAPHGSRINAFTQAHVLRWTDGEDVHGLNPHLVTQSNVAYLSELTMAYLARYDRANRPVPELATTIPTERNGGISRDGKTIAWHLRRGVRWSDGAPFSADDVVFSIKTVLNPKNNEVGLDGWDLITKIDEPDKYTVVMHLRRPYASYLPTFFGTAGANPCILPKHILGGLPTINDAAYNSLPVGIGPFRYKAWDRGEQIVLERNPYYWRGRAKLDEVVFRIIPDANTVLTQLQSGGLDMYVQVPYGFADRIGRIRGFGVVRHAGTFYDHVDFNNDLPVFRDPVVRQALRYGMNRPNLIAKVNHGLGILSDSVVPVPLASYDGKLRTVVPFDLAKAGAMLNAAGWKPGRDGVRAKGGVRLSFDFATASGFPDRDERIELIRSTWQQLGVTFTVRHYPASVLFGPYADNGVLYRGHFGAATFAWGGDSTGDVSVQYECTQIPPHGQNVSRYCNHATSAALEAYKRTYDPAKAQPYSNFFQEQIARDAPVIVLDSREDVYSVNADLKGFHPNAVTPFDDFMNVDI